MKLSFGERMGTLYREQILSYLKLLGPEKGTVLDIGCYDGYILSKLDAGFKVGVDLNPIHKILGINLVQADACQLPFQIGYFDRIYALDVIEHIENDDKFATELIRLVAKDGMIILTTPSASIRLNPPFLTRWLSRKWGHIYRIGYTPEILIELFSGKLDLKIQPWSGPWLRFWYPFVRIVQILFPRLAEKVIMGMGYLDSRNQDGQHGFQVMIGSMK